MDKGQLIMTTLTRGQNQDCSFVRKRFSLTTPPPPQLLLPGPLFLALGSDPPRPDQTPGNKVILLLTETQKI